MSSYPFRRTRTVASAVVLAAASTVYATDVHFDYASFDNPNTPGANPHFGQAQFDVLNYASMNGNYFMTSTDNHRPDMVAHGNALAEYYNNFLADYNTQFNGTGLNATAEADAINNYTNVHSTSNGPRPNYLVLNEISSSVWQDNTSKGIAYRQWVVDIVTRLHDTYNYQVITYAPFATVSTSHAADWQAVAAKSYIGVENYLSGAEVMSHGTDYASREAWAQAQYQASVTTYGAAGVPKSDLFLGEHFGNTLSSAGYGRAGISASDWDTVLQIRQDAIDAVGFPGFLAYAWGSNPMGITEAEQIEHEYYYRTRLVLPGQQPQWLSDDAYSVNGVPHQLSWGDQLNWIGGIPNSSGAVVNFYKTITSNRTVTLDGTRTAGTMTFNSPYTYTLDPGTGGSLIFNNGGAGAPLTVNGGNANITAAVQLNDNLNVNVVNAASNLTFAGGITNSLGKSINKTGGGTLVISGNQTHALNSSLNVSAGAVILNSDAAPTGARNLNLTDSSLVIANSTEHLKNLSVNNGSFKMSANGSRYLHLQTLSITGASGKLDLNDNDLIVDNGSFSNVQSLVFQGYRAGFDPSATGIISSTGQTASGNPILALFDNALVASSDYPFGSGNTISPNAIVGKYTYIGDTNWDGQVTPDDYGALDANLGATNVNPGLAWFTGDTNFDGIVTPDDYGALDANLGMGVGNPLSANGLAVVPEPALLGSLAGLLLLARRRRR